MGLNLSLEALLVTDIDDASVINEDFVDAIYMYNQSSENLTAAFATLDALCGVYEQLQSITDVLKEHPTSPGMEALLGGNFVGGLSLEAAEEAVVKTENKVKTFFVKVWQAIKEFFISLFSSIGGLSKRLSAWNTAASNAKADQFDLRAFTGLSDADMNVAAGMVVMPSNADENGIEKYEKLKMIELTLTSSSVKGYVAALNKAISALASNKASILKTCDDAIKSAKAVTNEDQKKKEMTNAKAAKAWTKGCIKNLCSTAAAFLAHNKIKGYKAEKPAEEPKKDETPKEENAE